MVPVPVAAMTAGSACCRSHSMVSPSDLCPSSRVSWKTRAAQSAGIRMRRPRPSTLVWRSFVEVRFGGGFFGGSTAEEIRLLWLDRFELLELLLEGGVGSAEIAKEGFTEGGGGVGVFMVVGMDSFFGSEST
ncbi:hypothetical protein G2W53_006933 [Senna tora]|uniref:Uncharacterized protein n=1 Tax=Senna tora TaxID=362788 RepID=A0A835CD11_9FABA|nr:hypothetical protein G2W53_006933 [Senna tora]